MAVASAYQAIDSGEQQQVILGRIWWVGLVDHGRVRRG